MKKYFSKEVIIGGSVVIAILLLVFGLNFLKGVNLLRPSNYYYVDYENVAGLDVSSPVRIEGYKVGQVRSIEFDYEHPGKFKVMLALDKGLKLPSDSKASMSTSLMGGASVDISLGKSRTPLALGGTIESSSSQDLMAKVQNEVLPTVNSILPKVDSLLINLNALISDPALVASIRRLDGISNSLLATSVGLQRTVTRDFPVVMGDVRRATGGIDSIASNLGNLSYQLRTLPLNASMQNVEELTRNLNRDVL